MTEDKSKQNKLDYLVDELGRIDDRFIQQCLSAECAEPKRSVFSKAVLLAAAVSVIALLALSVVMGSLVRGGMNKESISGADVTSNAHNENHFPSGDNDQKLPAPENKPGEDCEEDGNGDYAADLQELLYELSGYDQIDVISDPLALLDSGGMHVIWSYGDGNYYYLEIKEGNVVQNIESIIESDRNQTAAAVPAECCVWITLSDSRVYSPYLTNKQVDISSGKLEMYTAQRAIDSELELILMEAIYNELQ